MHNAGYPTGANHGNSNSSTKPNHVYVIVDTVTGKATLVKPGISGQALNKNGTSPRANKQVNNLNKASPGRYEAVIVEQGLSRIDAKGIEQLITDRSAARNGGAMPTPIHQLPLPQATSRQQFQQIYGFPDNRAQGGRY